MFPSSIVKLFKISKPLSLTLLIFVWLSSSGFQLPENLENFLTKIPYLNKIIRSESPPQKLQQEAQKQLEKAYWEGAPLYAKELWQKAQDYYQKGQKAISQKNYAHAKFYFKKAQELAVQAEKESIRTRKELKKKAQEKLQKFIKLHPELTQSLEGQMKIQLLKELIKNEKFKEFDERLAKWSQKLQKKRGKAPSPQKFTSP